jgi:large subunit ribosomal protein L12
MEYIYAAMLLHKAGKTITEDAIKKVLEAAGLLADQGRTKALVAALSGLDIDKAISEASASFTVSTAPAHTIAAPAEAKKEDKKKDESKSESQAAAGLSALFG